jgi:hypothetical protein
MISKDKPQEEMQKNQLIEILREISTKPELTY